MSDRKRKRYSRECKPEAVRLITEKGYSIVEVSQNPGIEHSVLRRWKKQLADDLDSAFPGKGKLKAQDEQMRKLKRELERVKEERDILKKAPACFLVRPRNRSTFAQEDTADGGENLSLEMLI